MTSAKGIRGIEDEIDYLCNYNGLMFPETIRKNNARVIFDTGQKSRFIHSFIPLHVGTIGEITVKENIKKYIRSNTLCDGTTKRSILE